MNKCIVMNRTTEITIDHPVGQDTHATIVWDEPSSTIQTVDPHGLICSWGTSIKLRGTKIVMVPRPSTLVTKMNGRNIRFIFRIPEHLMPTLDAPEQRFLVRSTEAREARPSDNLPSNSFVWEITLKEDSNDDEDENAEYLEE